MWKTGWLQVGARYYLAGQALGKLLSFSGSQFAQPVQISQELLVSLTDICHSLFDCENMSARRCPNQSSSLRIWRQCWQGKCRRTGRGLSCDQDMQSC